MKHKLTLILLALALAGCSSYGSQFPQPTLLDVLGWTWLMLSSWQFWVMIVVPGGVLFGLLVLANIAMHILED